MPWQRQSSGALAQGVREVVGVKTMWIGRGMTTAGLSLVLLLIALHARAGLSEEASAIKARGDVAFDNRRFAEALEVYESVLRLNRDARLHYNIAQSLSALERYPEAMVSYQAFLAEAPVGTLTEAQQAAMFSLVEQLKVKISRVRVECNVAGARVLLRGRMVGRTPLPSIVVLNAGDAKLEVIADGYRPYESILSLPGGALESIVVKLDRVDFRGTISVRGNVSSAEVFVDDALRGSAPLEIKLERGTHVVEVRAQGHRSHRQVVKVEAGKVLVIDANLERLPDYTIAYVGFGIGGVGIAAGTGAGILALSKMSKVKEQCDTVDKECGPAGQSHLQASSTWGVVSNVGFAVGAAGIGLGTYGLLTSKREAREPDVSLGANGVLVRGRF